MFYKLLIISVLPKQQSAFFIISQNNSKNNSENKAKDPKYCVSLGVFL